ncbi:MAG TPA: RnfABCDGE type electron transport complex subunit B, partial [Chitinophagaceae bacterium]|nr:RnfABCDGE type electron transport complex subunit B [Chitinophagaceae bacterium]
MNTAVMILIVMGIVGITFGFILAYANKKFAVEVNPLINVVEDILPKGQCGACGFAGCQAYAEAVVLNPDVAPNLCAPGKEAVAKAVAELTNKTIDKVEPRIAHIKCAGTINKTV